jgi:hypothetical protein
VSGMAAWVVRLDAASKDKVKARIRFCLVFMVLSYLRLRAIPKTTHN